MIVLNRTLVVVVIAGVACLACSDSESPPSKARDSGAEPADGGIADADTLDAGDGGIVPAPDCKATAPRACPEPAPHWKDVYPIFMRRCIGCHNGAGEEWPLSSYEHVADWYGEIRAQMLACTMPPLDAGIDMPVAERQTILSWIRCGFPK